MRLFEDIEETAIERIRTLTSRRLPTQVAFSGGKDSIVTLDLVRRSGVDHEAVYNVTTVDPPELVQFIRREYPDVRFDLPDRSMFRLIREKAFIPTRRFRFCCEALKERGGKNRTVITGVRWAESKRREAWGMVGHCPAKGKRVLHPIIDWTDAEVWDYIERHKLPYPSLYDEGFRRLGCVMCPLQGRKGMQRDAARWPRIAARYMRAFEAVVGKNGWQSAEEVMDWWISGDGAEKDAPLFS